MQITEHDETIISRETAESNGTSAEIAAEVRLDMLTGLMAEGGHSYRPPPGFPPRPRSGPFEADEEAKR